MKKLIVANWKMNGSTEMLHQHLEVLHNFDAVIALPNIYLGLGREILQKYQSIHLKLGTQDIGVNSGQGAYTSQISGIMLKEAGAEYVIIGHSEIRLQLRNMLNGLEFSEYDYRIFEDNYLLQQLQNAIDADICPIFCIGEAMTDRVAGAYIDFLMLQLAIINEIKNLKSIVIAYEPCWAIGSGVTPSLEQIAEVTDKISSFMNHRFSNVSLQILYGGSVNNTNISEILKTSNVDGALIGGASLQADKFKELLIKI